MAWNSKNTLQITWEHFVQADDCTFEKSCWFDAFLARLLAELKDEHDIKDVLSFCSIGDASIASLIGCEFLSDVYRLCDSRSINNVSSDLGELDQLRKYLTQERGWRCLSILHRLGAKELTSSGELVALLVALYPIISTSGQDEVPDAEPSTNPYLRFQDSGRRGDHRCAIHFSLVKNKRQRRRKKCNPSENGENLRVGDRGTEADSTKNTQNHSDSTGCLDDFDDFEDFDEDEDGDEDDDDDFEPQNGDGDRIDSRNVNLKGKMRSMIYNKRKKRKNFRERHYYHHDSSESEILSDNLSHLRTSNLKGRSTPDEFDSTIKSEDDEQHQRPKKRHSTPLLSTNSLKKISWEDTMDEEMKKVMNFSVNSYELSLLIIEVLQQLVEQGTKVESTLAVHVLKFALDTVWALEFNSKDSESLQYAKLKSAASKLMISALNKALQSTEPINIVIHNGLLPMTLKVLENVCRKSAKKSSNLEESSQTRQFILINIQAIFIFLHYTLRRGVIENKIDDFLQAYQLFMESQDGRLIERTIFSMIDLSCSDSQKTVEYICKIIDMVQILMRSLKKSRLVLRHRAQCSRAKFRGCLECKKYTVHHFDSFGLPMSEEQDRMVGPRLLSKPLCAIASLFSQLMILLEHSHELDIEIQIKFIKMMAHAGTCCCHSPILLLTNFMKFLQHSNSRCYGLVVTLIEEVVYQELGCFPRSDQNCLVCSVMQVKTWKFIDIYKEGLTLENPKLCHTIMLHLLKILPNSIYTVKQELLFRVLYPTFLRAKDSLDYQTEHGTLKFLIQSCLSAIASSMVNPSLFDKFMEMDALNICVSLLNDATFVKNVYALIEICVTMELRKLDFEQVSDDDTSLHKLYEGGATSILFRFLETETDKLMLLRNCNLDDASELTSLNSALHHACGVWRAAAGVNLCCPHFRKNFANHFISEKAIDLVHFLAIAVATDRLKGANKLPARVLEAVLTCCLVSPTPNKPSIISLLADSLMNSNIKLEQGASDLINVLTQVSMLRVNQEHTIPQLNGSKLSNLSTDFLTNLEELDDSTIGEYVTADDGYDADIEIPPMSSYKSLFSNYHQFNSSSDHPSAGKMNPTLCLLTIDLLIYYYKQTSDEQRISVVITGLKRLLSICKENISSCHTLAGYGAIGKILDGFSDIFVNQDNQLKELQRTVLDTFAYLAAQCISPNELLSYISFFKLSSIPILPLLHPLQKLLSNASPQPHFIISFPVPVEKSFFNLDNTNPRTWDKIEYLVKYLRNKHIESEICSPWSVHAICLPVGPEISWPVWVSGCSASMWLRIERNSVNIQSNGTIKHLRTPVTTDEDYLSEWGFLSHDWSHETMIDSNFPSIHTSVLHMLSIGFESLAFEIWIDLKCNKIILRLSRPEDNVNRIISETAISSALSPGKWHQVAFNFKDVIVNKYNALVEVDLWINGWKKINTQLPFDGLLVRKPGTTCVLLGQAGISDFGSWHFSNLMVFRYPVFNNEIALYLASLGPNYTNLANCIINNVQPDFVPLIKSGALGVNRDNDQLIYKHQKSRINSLDHHFETRIKNLKINWDSMLDASTSYLNELQDSLLLNYEAQNPYIIHMYPQGVNNPSVKPLFPGQPVFKVVSDPEHRIAQQPPLSLKPIAFTNIQSQQYKGLISSAILIGGMPIFLYLFARIVELHSSEEEQAAALSVILYLVKSDFEILNQYRAEGGVSLTLKILESPRCHAGKYMLKTIIDAACDKPVLLQDSGTKLHFSFQEYDAVITDPELLKKSIQLWRIWVRNGALNLLLQTLLFLLKDQHVQREFNAIQLNRVGVIDTLLLMCKEYFLNDEIKTVLDANVGSIIVELIRSLMGAPPEISHIVMISDFLILIHQASETYVTHTKSNMYFYLPYLEDNSVSLHQNVILSTSSNESMNLENTKLTKALKNVEIQKNNILKQNNLKSLDQNDSLSQNQDTSTGEDSGIAPSENSNRPTKDVKSFMELDSKKVCKSLVTEGLLLLLHDALRVLPDNSITSVFKNILKIEILLVLSNNPDARVRTAIVKILQVYLERAGPEEINKFIKHKYFIHVANQISLYPGNEPLVVTLENLALRGPGLAAMPLVLAMIPRAATTDSNVARPLILFITDVIRKNVNVVKNLFEQGLMESVAQALVNVIHADVRQQSLLKNIYILLVTIVTKLLESPGNQFMHAVADLHTILNLVEFRERRNCGSDKPCIYAVRDAQVSLFDSELDILAPRVSNNAPFQLRNTVSYLASNSSNALTASSEYEEYKSPVHSTHSFNSALINNSRKPSKGELNERFRLLLNKAVDFVTNSERPSSYFELQFTQRLFTILLFGTVSTSSKLDNWMQNIWFMKPARKNTAKILIWLMSPQQNITTRIYVIRTLMEEPVTKEILLSLLEVHPQIEQKFTVFLWDLLQKKTEMPSVDWRICNDFKKTLKQWNLAKGLYQENQDMWIEELNLFKEEFLKEREYWIENQKSLAQRLSNRYDSLLKQLTESAMSITRNVVEEQNGERKRLLERLKYTRTVEAQTVAKWRDLVKRLIHEHGPWFFEDNYPNNWELDPTEGPGRVRIRLQRCHLNINERFFLSKDRKNNESNISETPLSFLFTSDKENANSTTLIERLHTTEKIRKMSHVQVVTPQTESPGEALIGEKCFYFIPDTPGVPIFTDIALGGLDLAMAGGIAWKLDDIRELHCRRYQLQERAVEIFLTNGRTYLLAFNLSKERDEFITELSNCDLPSRVPGDDLGEALALWRNGVLSNWEYITCLNKLAGRSYNDLMQYPVFPFVLSDYLSDTINLKDPAIYRNFKRPMAIQDKKNEQHYINNYNYLKQALTEGLNLIALNQEPFHYGSHYSNSGTVLHFLVRLPPFTSMFLNYQDNNFDIPDRTFHALATTWRLTSCDSTTDVKELIPEFFYLPEFLLNLEGFNFGVRQNGNRVNDVELPKWCGGDARLFILVHRAALEADYVREVLPYWIDLVFGYKQTGKPAVDAINVFHPATYYGFNIDQIADQLERQAWETMVKTYGQTPAQLFKTAHPLSIQNLSHQMNTTDAPAVIEGVHSIRWGNYVGAPGNDPVICWKNKNRVQAGNFISLATGDVFGLPKHTTLLLAYSKDKRSTMFNNVSVCGAALVSWNNTDNICRLKTKKELPPKPLIKFSGLDIISVMKSAPDCKQLWIGYSSGRILVYSFNIDSDGKIDFNKNPSALFGHRKRITSIELSRSFSIAVSGDNVGTYIIWDLNNLMYVRSIVSDQNYTISQIVISETLGDIAVVYQQSILQADDTKSYSYLKVYTINTRLVGTIASKTKITALCYSNAPEGMSVNVIATGHENGIIRFWSSWDLKLIREIPNTADEYGAIIALSWSYDQHHLYAATEDRLVIIWEGAKKLSSGTPKFINLSSL